MDLTEWEMFITPPPAHSGKQTRIKKEGNDFRIFLFFPFSLAIFGNPMATRKKK